MKRFFVLSLVATALLGACATTTPATTPNTTTPAVAEKQSATIPTITTNEQVGIVMTASVVRSTEAGEVLEPITAQTKVNSGDLVEYHVFLTNNGNDRIRDMRVALQLPKGTQFTGMTSPDLGVQGSLDGVRFGFMPIRYPADTGELKNVPFNQYQALRWNVQEVGIGATAVIKYRALVE